MSEEDRRKWDERHAAADPGGTAAPAFLAWAGDRLPARGRALDVACGRGDAALALAARGFVVDAVDISLVALGMLRREAAARGLSAAVHTLVCDLDDGLPEALPPFDLVLCTHFHQPSLWPALRGALAPGGVLAMETLTTANDDLGLGGPSRRFLVEPGRLRDAAEGLAILAFEESLSDGRMRARLLARRS